MNSSLELFHQIPLSAAASCYATTLFPDTDAYAGLNVVHQARYHKNLAESQISSLQLQLASDWPA